MKQLFSPSRFLLVVIALPTQTRDQWELEKYRRIPANEVSFSPQGIRIQVRNSASPLMYPLAQTATISRFKISGEFFGLPRLTDPGRQGEKGADDYVLRLGLIVPGSKQLNGLQKLLAPGWITNLYEKMPKGMGLEHVRFFNVTQNPAQLNSARVHPGSDLIREEFIAVAAKPGPFQIEHSLKSPESAVAVWISSDGDDTQSSYDVVISKLEFTTAP